MPSMLEQDPVLEEEKRKDKKPVVSVREARRLALEHFDLKEPTLLDRLLRLGLPRPATKIVSLNSYDDSNFLFYKRYVVKFYNGVESGWPNFIDAQAKAMERLQSAGIVCNTPLKAKSGKDVAYVILASEKDGEKVWSSHAMRLLSFIPGKLLGDVKQTEKHLLDAGQLIGKVDKAFQNFEHTGFDRNHFWDLKHSLKLRGFLKYIQSESRRTLVSQLLDEFEEKVVPCAEELRESVIHNDANDQNILTDEKGSEVIGVLDMGDMVKSWLVCEIAIAMAYIMLNKEDILRDASLLLAGYSKQITLQTNELEILRILVACRLACSSTMSAYSYSKNPENEYLLLTQEPGWKTLEAFMKIPEQDVLTTFTNAAEGKI